MLIQIRKGRGTRDQIANICWIIKKARKLLKNFFYWNTVCTTENYTDS